MNARAQSPGARREGRSGLFWVLVVIALLGVAMLVSRKPSGPPVGSAAREFDLPAVGGEGGRVRLSGLRGSPVVVEVFASWCSACRQAAPMLAEASRAERETPVRFVGISVDQSAETAANVKRSWDIPYTVLFDDGSVASAYGINLLPTFVLIDAEGQVRRVESGVPRASTLERWLTELGAAKR